MNTKIIHNPKEGLKFRVEVHWGHSVLPPQTLLHHPLWFQTIDAFITQALPFDVSIFLSSVS